MNPGSSPDFVVDELFELQLRVARRADEIARSRDARTSLNLECWLLAEQEYFKYKSAAINFTDQPAGSAAARSWI